MKPNESTLRRIAFDYVSKCKQLNELRSKFDLYFDYIEPYVRKFAAGGTIEGQIDEMKHAFTREADLIAEHIAAGQGKMIQQRILQSIKLNAELSAIEKKISVLPMADAENFVAYSVYYELVTAFDFDKTLLKKLEAPALTLNALT
jgi:hypothetical protein